MKSATQTRKKEGFENEIYDQPKVYLNKSKSQHNFDIFKNMVQMPSCLCKDFIVNSNEMDNSQDLNPFI